MGIVWQSSLVLVCAVTLGEVQKQQNISLCVNKLSLTPFNKHHKSKLRLQKRFGEKNVGQ